MRLPDAIEGMQGQFINDSYSEKYKKNKLIKIYMLHSKERDAQGIRDLLKWDERADGYEFVIDPISPDYLIITELIFYSKPARERFFELLKSRPIVIYFPFEFICADMNYMDYAIVWDRHFKVTDRVCRIPTLYRYKTLTTYFTEPRRFDESALDRKFCNFIYSNSGAHPYRDKLFYELNTYKRVDSLGGWLNNTGNEWTRKQKNWLDLSIEMKGNYKFTISANNHWFVGGIDEKLLTTYAAGSIPIFWGDPTVGEEFNPDSIIDCSKYKTFEELIDFIREIDNDDELYMSMLNAPIQLEWQKKKDDELISEYLDFIRNIFKVDKEDARRAGEGSARNAYMDFVRYGQTQYAKKKPIIHRVKRAIKQRITN